MTKSFLSTLAVCALLARGSVNAGPVTSTPFLPEAMGGTSTVAPANDDAVVTTTTAAPVVTTTVAPGVSGVLSTTTAAPQTTTTAAPQVTTTTTEPSLALQEEFASGSGSGSAENKIDYVMSSKTGKSAKKGKKGKSFAKSAKKGSSARLYSSAQGETAIFIHHDTDGLC